MLKHTLVILCAGPSFRAEDYAKLHGHVDTLVINMAHIPIRNAYGDSLLPTFFFSADWPCQTGPEEWHKSEDVLCVARHVRTDRILRRGAKYVEGFHMRDCACESDPWTVNHILRKPLKSILLAMQWAYKQGYTTIALYGAELRNPSIYGGNPDFKATEVSSRGKGRSHAVEDFCIYHWNERAKLRGSPRIINLSATSIMADFLETMTIDEFFVCKEKVPAATPSVVYEELYDRCYSKGYHKEFSNSRGAPFAQHLIRTLEFQSTLDIGCSKGFVVDIFAQNNKQSYGIEICQEAVDDAKSRGLNVRQGSATELPFADNSIDLVFSSDVMEHLMPEDVEKAISEQVRVSNRYIAAKIYPHQEGCGPRLGEIPLHLTVQPLQRWIEMYEKHGLKCIAREHQRLVFEKRKSE